MRKTASLNLRTPEKLLVGLRNSKKTRYPNRFPKGVEGSAKMEPLGGIFAATKCENSA
ncbi:Uncharacterized protein dnm_015740 [Desulfonema magnum]|uniref:Uncharacterized protein n=1 Tax=Desulfonema magnum TaxID=45655 RepID=A0A975BHS4_9BACT|nr:Uncharacterized protein dnm_015740 [Desulfonema magnum]